MQVRTRHGDVVDCLVSAEIVITRDETCVLSVLQDITERKRTEVELFAAIEATMQDTSWFSRTLIEKLANIRRPHGANRTAAELSHLTARERDILAVMCQGLADKEIARRLGISLNTVRNHVATIYRKIDVHRRGAAIVWARERGFTGDGLPQSTNRKERDENHKQVARERPRSKWTAATDTFARFDLPIRGPFLTRPWAAERGRVCRLRPRSWFLGDSRPRTIVDKDRIEGAVRQARDRSSRGQSHWRRKD